MMTWWQRGQRSRIQKKIFGALRAPKKFFFREKWSFLFIFVSANFRFYGKKINVHETFSGRFTVNGQMLSICVHCTVLCYSLYVYVIARGRKSFDFFYSDLLYFYVVSYLVTSILFTSKQDHSVQKMTAVLDSRHPNTAVAIIKLQDFIQKWPTLSWSGPFVTTFFDHFNAELYNVQ